MAVYTQRPGFVPGLVGAAGFAVKHEVSGDMQQARPYLLRRPRQETRTLRIYLYRQVGLGFGTVDGCISGAIDDAYIDNFYPLDRIAASIFLYCTWFIIFLGIIFYRKENNYLKNNFLFSTLLISALIYILFIGTTAVESRFGFIIFLLLLPFSGFGIKFISNLYSNSTSKTSLIKNGFKLYIPLISFILVFFYLSFWMDLQTRRIDWFDKFLNIL